MSKLAKEILERAVPAYGWLRGYGRSDLSRDFSTALIITVMLVPQSMAYALLTFLRRTPFSGAYPHIIELGYVEEEDSFIGVQSYPEATIFPEALILRFDARLYYANIPFLEEYLISKVPERPDLKYIVIDSRGINSIDVTALEGLENLITEYKSRDINIVFTNMKKQVRERLLKSGWKQELGDISYPTTRDALRDLGLLQEHEISDPGVR